MKKKYFFIVITCLLTLSCTSFFRQKKLFDTANQAIVQSDFKEAIINLESIIDMNNTTGYAKKAYSMLGFIYEIYGKNYREAIKDYKAFLSLEKNVWPRYEIKKKIASLYLDYLMEPEEAIKEYTQLIEDYPESMEMDFLFFKKGESFYQASQFENAISQFQKLLAHFPKSAKCEKARFQILNSYYLLGNYDVAVDAVTQFVRLYPQSPLKDDAVFIMGQSLEQSQKYKEALLVFKKLSPTYSPKEVLDLRIANLAKKIR